MQDRDFARRERRNLADRIAVESQHLRFGEIVGGQRLLPILRAAEPFAFAARPTLHVADRRLAVDGVHPVGVFRGPVIDEETAAADALQRHARREAEVQHHVIVKRLPGGHRARIAEDVRQVEVGQVKAFGKQAERRARLVIGKARAPEPWLARRGDARQHDIRRVTIEREIAFLVPVPEVGLWRLRALGEEHRSAERSQKSASREREVNRHKTNQPQYKRATRLVRTRPAGAIRFPEADPSSRPGPPPAARNSAAPPLRSQSADGATTQRAFQGTVAGERRPAVGVPVWHPSKSRSPAPSRCESSCAPALQDQRPANSTPPCATPSDRFPRSQPFYRDAPRSGGAFPSWSGHRRRACRQSVPARSGRGRY